MVPNAGRRGHSLTEWLSCSASTAAAGVASAGVEREGNGSRRGAGCPVVFCKTRVCQINRRGHSVPNRNIIFVNTSGSGWTDEVSWIFGDLWRAQTRRPCPLLLL